MGNSNEDVLDTFYMHELSRLIDCDWEVYSVGEMEINIPLNGIQLGISKGIESFGVDSLLKEFPQLT